MLSRVSRRVITSAAAAALILGALPAFAATDPPFEVLFPQETGATDFSSTFGAPRSGGRRHKGNDLLAPKMTEVYAVADGVVIRVTTDRLAGRHVEIEHVEGWTTYYMHLNNDSVGTDDGDAPWSLTVAPGIEEGATVVAGQLIGWVGDSGNAEGTTSHTHFELRHNGRAVNPYRILAESYEKAVREQRRLEAMVARDQAHYPID